MVKFLGQDVPNYCHCGRSATEFLNLWTRWKSLDSPKSFTSCPLSQGWRKKLYHRV